MFNFNKKIIKMKIFYLLFLLFINFFFSFSYWQSSYYIIPQAGTWSEDMWEMVRSIWEISPAERGEWITVRTKYNESYDEIHEDLWAQFATWIMSWDTILNFAAHLVAWMSQIGLIIWAAMIIYSWYIYASSVFTWNATKWADPVKNAIIWILIIIFSYAIIRIITEMFL